LSQGYPRSNTESGPSPPKSISKSESDDFTFHKVQKKWGDLLFLFCGALSLSQIEVSLIHLFSDSLDIKSVLHGRGEGVVAMM